MEITDLELLEMSQIVDQAEKNMNEERKRKAEIEIEYPRKKKRIIKHVGRTNLYYSTNMIRKATRWSKKQEK